MNLTPLFSNEFASIEADSQHKLIQVTWLQHTSHVQLREILVKASELARTKGLQNWLFDMRKLNFTTNADKSWSANELFPSFDLEVNHQIACVATPQNVELMTGTKVAEAIEQHPDLSGKIELKVFISPESALQWLLQEEHNTSES